MIEDLKDFAKMFFEFIGYKKNKIHPLVFINGEPEIGENVYIGALSIINAKGANMRIEDNCDIASFVNINCADSHKKCIGLEKEIVRKDIVLAKNVFVGSHSVIKGGTFIDHHCVVVAGTVVEPAYYPPYSLIYGIYDDNGEYKPLFKPEYYKDKLKEK